MIGKSIAHSRATDTKLGREVALKVLPPVFANDAQRMTRFKREAHVLASLNHPNIASIYGLEEADGIHCLVLELVEGPTLAERIQEGAVPLWGLSGRSTGSKLQRLLHLGPLKQGTPDALGLL